MQRARASAAMVLNSLFQNILILVPEGLIFHPISVGVNVVDAVAVVTAIATTPLNYC